MYGTRHLPARAVPLRRAAKHHAVQSGTASLTVRPYNRGMDRNHTKTAIVAGWILGLGTIAGATTLASSGGWTLLLAWGLLLPLLLIGLRKQQEPTLSEIIREALRQPTGRRL